MNAAVLSLRLLRAGGRKAFLAAGLVGAGVAVGAMMLAVAVGALHGWDVREAASAWRTGQPTAAAEAPIAMIRTSTDIADGRPLHRVDLVVRQPDAAPPPGLPRMPAAGEVWVSPALADLMRTLPPDALAQRFPPVSGELSAAGVAGPDELVAIVGAADGTVPDATPIATFTGGDFDNIEIYRQLTFVAAALMVFPVMSLLGASARLTAARRTERLALLRLLGASTRQVTVAAVTEVTAVATLAAAVGVVAEWLLAPALAAIALGGTTWHPYDLVPGIGPSLGIVAAVGVLAMLAAIGGMREVVVGPLGVARRSNTGSARLIRLLGVAAAIAVFAVTSGLGQTSSLAAVGIVTAIGVLAMFATVTLLGPLILRLLAGGMVRTAKTPAVLLAGRRLLDDPRGAFRPLAGVVLAVFVAGFLAPLTSSIAGMNAGDDRALHVVAPAGAVTGLDGQVTAVLRDRGIVADVTVGEFNGEPSIAVTPVVAADRDRIRTALAPLTPGNAVRTAVERDTEGVVLVGDLLRGAIVVLCFTFLIAATATGTASAARVLDHRRTLRNLRLAGTPMAVLDAARRAETLRPMLVLGGIALGMGLLCASPFAAASGALEPSGLIVLGAVLVAGAALVVAAAAATTPLLRAVTTAPARED